MSNISYIDAGGSGGSSIDNYYKPLKITGQQRDVPLIFLLDEPNIEFITELSNNLLSLKVSLTMDEASALTFEIIDPGFEMTRRNYFQPGQTLVYRAATVDGMGQVTAATYYGYPFEIADVTYSQSQGASPIISIQAYTKAIQQMKRDRDNIGAIKDTGTAFVRNAAFKYGLEFVGEQTTKSQQITKASGEQQADSLWDVITKLAGDAKFKCFESDGTLYFGSQKWLLHKWGVEPYTYSNYDKKKAKQIQETRYRTFLTYPPYIDPVTRAANNKFILQQLPTIQVSINDPLEGSGSCIVDRVNGVRLRPGMTVYVGEIPYVSGYFLITSVDFDELSPDPVAINFRTLERLPKDIKQIAVGSKWSGKVRWPTNIYSPRYGSASTGSYGGGGEVV